MASKRIFESDSENESEVESDNENIPIYQKQLLEIFKSVEKISNYAYGESFHKCCIPRLDVHGIGPLRLPLNEDHAKALVARCARAPFGHGEQTVIDTTVRNTWQLSPTEFTIENECQWEAFVDKLAEKACFELGFTNAIIEKKLYKLLVYEQGGFFRPHRDSEKEKGMFASLIIILPSNYEGGQLVIRHNGKEKEFDFGGPKSNCTINYAAFYADCEHEVRAITQGYRICLVYNIINSGQDPVPLPPNNTTLVEQIAETFQLWESDPNGPIKLIYLLEHEYTDNSLSFRNLKGRDRAIAQLMKQVQSYIGAVMVLANLKWNVTVHGNEDEGIFGFGKMNLDPIIGVDGDSFVDEGLGVFKVDQVLNQELFNSRIPKSEVESETGNEGVEILRQYRATGLVFCSKKNSSIMRYDLLGAKLSITRMATITESEAREQAQALLKSTVLIPRDSENRVLLVRLLTLLRQFRLSDMYLDLLKRLDEDSDMIDDDESESDILSEFVQGCSELGWTELVPTILHYIGENKYQIDSYIAFFHDLALSIIPDDDQQRQSRSELLDNILKAINRNIEGFNLSRYHESWPILIESLHYLGHHSLIANFIEKYARRTIDESSRFDLKAALLVIKTTCRVTVSKHRFSPTSSTSLSRRSAFSTNKFPILVHLPNGSAACVNVKIAKM